MKMEKGRRLHTNKLPNICADQLIHVREGKMPMASTMHHIVLKRIYSMDAQLSRRRLPQNVFFNIFFSLGANERIFDKLIHFSMDTYSWKTQYDNQLKCQWTHRKKIIDISMPTCYRMDSSTSQITGGKNQELGEVYEKSFPSCLNSRRFYSWLDWIRIFSTRAWI